MRESSQMRQRSGQLVLLIQQLWCLKSYSMISEIQNSRMLLSLSLVTGWCQIHLGHLLKIFKGTVAWDFFVESDFADPLICDLKQFWIKIWIRWKIQLPRSFCAMGHCGEFFYALWANMANLVVRYGPLRRIWFCAMGHCDGFGYALWTTAWNEAVQ